jgi:hypothetical protein
VFSRNFCVHGSPTKRDSRRHGLAIHIADLDIYRAANELIKQHGDEAPIHAAMRADELLEAGDMDGKAVWVRIMNAVKKLPDRNV